MNTTTLLFAVVAGLGVLMFFIGLARTPTTNTAQMVQQRLQVYGAAGSDKPLTLEEVELSRPFSERFLRPAIERLGTMLSRSTPAKAHLAQYLREHVRESVLVFVGDSRERGVEPEPGVDGDHQEVHGIG